MPRFLIADNSNCCCMTGYERKLKPHTFGLSTSFFSPMSWKYFYNFLNLFSVNIPSYGLSGTLPRHHPVVSMSGLSLIPQPQQPSYISSSILGHPTMRRQSSHDMEQNMPRILSRNAPNVQYYYGWQTPPTLLSPAIHPQTLPFPVVVSAAGIVRPVSISPLPLTSPLTISTSNNDSQAISTVSTPAAVSTVSTTTTTSTGDGGMGRTYCF